MRGFRLSISKEPEYFQGQQLAKRPRGLGGSPMIAFAENPRHQLTTDTAELTIPRERSQDDPQIHISGYF